MIYNQAFFIIALCGAVANAHICMWSPNQRGGANVATPGESVCYKKVGPCGGVASAEPTTTLEGGKAFTILFQQNLNHYYLENPGQLVADFATVPNPAEGDFTALGAISDYNALNEITQTNFTMRVQIPNIDSEHSVVRLRYVSQNPTENDRGMTFYQCADVKITKSAEGIADAVKPVAPVAPTRGGGDCCAAKQFTMEGYETNSWRNPTAKKYYFDAAQNLFRVDTNSGTGTTPKDGHFQMFSNFTSGIEFYYNVATDFCDLYGLNYWSDWCYGSYNQQTFSKSIHVGSEVADVWAKEGTPFTWTNARDTCAPVAQARTDTGENTFFFNYKAGAPDSKVFELPQACIDALGAMKDKSSLKPALATHKAF